MYINTMILLRATASAFMAWPHQKLASKKLNPGEPDVTEHIYCGTMLVFLVRLLGQDKGDNPCRDTYTSKPWIQRLQTTEAWNQAIHLEANYM